MIDPSRAVSPSGVRRRALDCLLVAGVTLCVLALSAWNLPKGLAARTEREFFDLLLFHDPYFYFHRVRLTLDDFPVTPLVDRFIFYRDAYPGGHVIPAPVGFSFLVSVWCRVLGATAASVLEVARTSAPIVPVIGALATLLVYAAARVLGRGDRMAALLAAVFLLTVPVHHFYAQYGQVDHQVIEPLVPALAMILMLRAVLGASRRPVRDALLAGVLADVALLFWPGAFIPIGIVHLVLVALALHGGREVVRLALVMALAAAVGAPLLLFTSPEPARLDIWTVSLLHPLVYAIALAFWAGALGLLRLATRRRLAILVVAAAAVVGVAAVVPGALRTGIEFVLRQDPVVAFVPEAQSLFSDRESVLQYLGPHAVLLPLALIGAIVLAVRRRPERATWIAAATWLAAAVGLAALQFRFSTYLPIPLCVALGLIAALLWRTGPIARFALGLALAGSLWFGVDRAIYCEPAGPNVDADARALERRESAFHESALFLRGSEPRFRLARPGAEPLPRPVAVELFMGHQVIALGERPVIASGFGSDLESHYVNAEIFTLAEPDAVALCDRYQVQYLFACELPPYLREGYRRMASERHALPDQSLNERLIRENGIGDQNRRAIASFRAVFEPEQRPWVRVFERVKGAVLPVETAPGAEVTVRVELKCAHGHPLAWQDAGRADPQGHFLLVLPYATTAPNGELRAEGGYGLTVAGRRYALRVGEAQVVNGETLGQGDLRALP